MSCPISWICDEVVAVGRSVEWRADTQRLFFFLSLHLYHDKYMGRPGWIVVRVRSRVVMDDGRREGPRWRVSLLKYYTFMSYFVFVLILPGWI
jgi:hypothetical protein